MTNSYTMISISGQVYLLDNNRGNRKCSYSFYFILFMHIFSLALSAKMTEANYKETPSLLNYDAFVSKNCLTTCQKLLRKVSNCKKVPYIWKNLMYTKR